MNIAVAITGLNPRQTALAAEILADLNLARVAQNEPVYTSLDEWGEDIITQNLLTMVREKDRTKGEIRREAWVQADDAKRAQVDALLGV